MKIITLNSANSSVDIDGAQLDPAQIHVVAAGELVSLQYSDFYILFLVSSTLIQYVDGAGTHTGTANQIINAINEFKAANSGGTTAMSYTASDGVTWNGFQSYTASANKDFLIGTKTSGVMLYKNTGSYTFKVYGVTIAVNNSSTNGGRTTITYVTHTDGKLWVESDVDGQPKEVTLPSPDLTAPTIVSIEAIDANTLEVTFSESVSGTISGWSASNGSAVAISSVSGAGAVRQFTTSTAMLNTDTLTMSYNSSTGNTVDGASNVLASVTNHAVTNSIGGGLVFNDITYSSFGSTQQDATDPLIWKGANTNSNSGDAFLSDPDLYLANGQEGYYICQRDDSKINSILNVTLEFALSPTGAGYFYGAQQYGIADEFPCVGLISSNGSFLRGKPASAGGNGTMGYPYGTYAISLGTIVSNLKYYGMWRDSSGDVHAVTSSDKVSFTDHGVIGHYTGALYPAYNGIINNGYGIYKPQLAIV